MIISISHCIGGRRTRAMATFRLLCRSASTWIVLFIHCASFYNVIRQGGQQVGPRKWPTSVSRMREAFISFVSVLLIWSWFVSVWISYECDRQWLYTALQRRQDQVTDLFAHIFYPRYIYFQRSKLIASVTGDRKVRWSTDLHVGWSIVLAIQFRRRRFR